VPETPAYLRIAGDLRAAILSGDLEPGAKLPSETKLMAQYGVSRTVAKWAMSVLKGEGIVEGRRGSGTFVRSVQRLVRHAHGRGQRAADRSTSPFARDADRAGQHGAWRHRSERVSRRVASTACASVGMWRHWRAPSLHISGLWWPALRRRQDWHLTLAAPVRYPKSLHLYS